MSQKTINVGLYPDSGTGDTVRNAMIKVNDNFTEVFETTTALSNKLSVDATSVTITGDLIPAADLTYNLGSAAKRWHSMYIGANTIYIGDNTVVSGTSLSILGDPNASSLAQMPTLVSSRLIAKPFIYTSSGSVVTVRPSIEFQATDGTSYPISFNTSTNEFSLDAAGDHGTGSLVAKKITLTNTGATALSVSGNIVQTGNLRIDGDTTIGYDSSDIMTVKATTMFEGGVTLGNGGDNVTVYAGAGNTFNVTASNFTLSPTGAVIPGNLTIQGNLNIQGTTTTIDSNQVNIGDNILVLNSDVPGSQDPTENAGIQISRGTEAAAKWLWDETNDYWSPMGGNMGNINTLTVGTLNATMINGNASTATKLATARTIALSGDVTGSASFDGSGNISITTVAGTVGSAATATTATKLATARTISLTGDATGSTTFDGSANATINTSITFPVTSVAGKTGAVALAIADVTGLQTALDAKQASGSYAAAVHSHAIADVTGLQTALDGKQAAGSYAAAVHTHLSADITDATSANTASTLVKRDASGNFSAGTITAALAGNAATATKLATARTISTTGDATGSASFDGSANAAIALTLASSGVTAGSYGSTTSVPAITVDAKGRVTAASSTAIAFPVTTVAGRTGAITLAIADVTGLQTALDGKQAAGSYAAAVHTHAIADVTGLQTALDGKQAAGSYAAAVHTHLSADITDAASANTASVLVKRDASGNFSAGTITAALSGNASTATKLATARTISTTGDATGSASFDGSANAAIALTLASSGVTAGSYGSTTSIPAITVDAKGRITAASTNTIPTASTSTAGLVQLSTATNSTSTTTAATSSAVKSAYDLAAAALPSAGGTITGDLILGGNLTVNGSTVTVNSTVTTIDDPVITLGGDTAPTIDDGKDRGIEFRYHNGTAAKVGFFGYDDSTGHFAFLTDATNTSEAFSGTTGTVEANLIGAVTGNASTATKLATARTISTTGDATGSASFDGSANAAIALTLASSGVTAGSYGSTTTVPAITVDAKGRITSASSTAIAFPVTTVAGRTGAVTIASADITDATSANTASTLVKRDASGNFSAGTITAALTGNASTATKLATARTISTTGDATGSASFDGSANAAIALTLAASGVTAGSYGSTTEIPNITVDTKGRITSVTTSAITIPASSDNMLQLTKTESHSLAQSALWLSGASGALMMDDNGNKRISWNDGAANLSIMSGCYHNGTNIVYAKSAGYADGGASVIHMSSDATDGYIKLGVSSTNTPGSTVTLSKYLEITTSGVLVNGTAVSLTGHTHVSADITDAASANTASVLVKRDASGNFSAGTITAALSGNASTATKLATARTISTTGDATGSASFDGSANAAIALTLASSGVTAGTYGSTTTVPAITVDAKGRVTAASSTAIAFPVTSVAGRTGAITLTSSDITTALGYSPVNPVSSGMLKLTNASAQSTSDAALWCSGATGAIMLDDAGHKRISWSDGSSNLSFQSGTYFNGTNLVYAKGVGAADGGVACLAMNSDASDGFIRLAVAPIGVAGSTVAYTKMLDISPSGATFNGILTLGGAQTGAIEMGQQGTANTPYIDFHSGATNVDYDSRIMGSGGNGTIGKGTLNYYASTHAFTGDIQLTGSMIGTLSVNGTGIGSVEIGQYGGTTQPYIDFHSGTTTIDYDSRIIGSGGNGTIGQGTLNYYAATHAFSGNSTISGNTVVSGSVGVGGASAWSFVDNGGTLTIKYNGVTLFTLTSAGALTVKGDITAFGNI